MEKIMKKDTELTPYQQSIIDFASKKPLKRKIASLTQSFLIVGLAAGFYSLYMETLPAALTGWLILATVSYIVWNYIGVVFVGVMNIVVHLLHWMLKIAIDDVDWESKTRIDKIRVTTTDFVKTTKPFCVKFDVYSILDVAADSLLFTMLVTVNRPYMAVFYVVPIVLQWMILSNLKKTLIKAIKLLPDTLEEKTPTNIDKLMDDLCNGPQDQ